MSISGGQNLLKIFGGNQILILAMPAEETGYIRTQRNHTQMIGACKVQRGPRELRGQPLAFERGGNFGVLQHDAVREAPIREERVKPVHGSFESAGLFIVGDYNIVQV